VTTAGQVLDSGQVPEWARGLVRVGYAAKGAVYALVGLLALAVVAGMGGGRLTDTAGSLRTVADQPFGAVWLGVIGVGLVIYGLWEAVEGLVDTHGKGRSAVSIAGRLFTAGKGLIYAALGWRALRMAIGDGVAAGGSDGSEKVSRETLQLPFGEWLLWVVALGVMAYGGWQVWNAIRGKLGEDLDAGEVRRAAGPLAVYVSRAGIAARGVTLTIIGIAFARAATTHDASEASGLGESLGFLLRGPFGSWALGLIAAGLICYGAYQVLHARYAEI
jgi:Domain of Unknown Function (DUF1206)